MATLSCNLHGSLKQGDGSNYITCPCCSRVTTLYKLSSEWFVNFKCYSCGHLFAENLLRPETPVLPVQPVKEQLDADEERFPASDERVCPFRIISNIAYCTYGNIENKLCDGGLVAAYNCKYFSYLPPFSPRQVERSKNISATDNRYDSNGDCMRDKIKAIAEKYLEYNGKSYRHPQGLAVSITEDEGQFMYDFIKKHDLTTGFEIGTGTGYSGLWFSPALGRFYTMDSYEEDRGRVQCREDCRHMMKELGQYNYFLVRGTSPLETPGICNLRRVSNIDFVFIDGNHKSGAPVKDFLGIHPFMAKKAVIFWHDSECALDAMGKAVEKGFSTPMECNVKSTYGLAMQTRGFSDS